MFWQIRTRNLIVFIVILCEWLTQNNGLLWSGKKRILDFCLLKENLKKLAMQTGFFYGDLSAMCFFFKLLCIKARFVFDKGLSVSTFSHLRCGSQQLLQSYCKPVGCSTDYCSSCLCPTVSLVGQPGLVGLLFPFSDDLKMNGQLGLLFHHTALTWLGPFSMFPKCSLFIVWNLNKMKLVSTWTFIFIFYCLWDI